VVSVAFVAVLVVAGVRLARRGRRTWAAVCFAAAAAPYVLQGAAVIGQDLALKRRADHLAALERTPLTADHPRVLEAQIPRRPAAQILSRGWFDEVHAYNDPVRARRLPEQRRVYRWRNTPECELVAAEAQRLSYRDR